jgi:hypothetical protein
MRDCTTAHIIKKAQTISREQRWGELMERQEERSHTLNTHKIRRTTGAAWRNVVE